MDFLRTKIYLNKEDNLFKAIDLLKNHPRVDIVRIKNRMQAIGDVMINFWYDGTIIAEC